MFHSTLGWTVIKEEEADNLHAGVLSEKCDRANPAPPRNLSPKLETLTLKPNPKDRGAQAVSRGEKPNPNSNPKTVRRRLTGSY